MVTIRKGGPDDFQAVIQFFDDAVVWLTERGSEGQWGSKPWSGIPKRVEWLREMVAGPGVFIAEIDGEPAGALIVSQQCPDMVTPVDEPELYIRLLITSRKHTGNDVGGHLIRHSLAEAERLGVGLLRVDCWAGGDGDLVRYYEGQGFTPTFQFDHQGWIGQVFDRRLP
ncbi:Acetyltransferase (GNAT) family protein [Amycolatopsis xylanica]|uniref:Acetyltransferase (GNAT) family protein n=1 Tax=Amycolatopsis xylanica TaxID=589385 RepID=A0A1H3E3H5_9PSEU|nr:GNAT family N-acetyltransferase [Amycolatopsis xylanica]SDX72479.1 Acetyltransferase (GNAT) family protein [Amycolatopsis xylanica]